MPGLLRHAFLWALACVMFAALVVQSEIRCRLQPKKRQFWRDEHPGSKTVRARILNSSRDLRRDKELDIWPNRDGTYALVMLDWQCIWHEYLPMPPEVQEQVLHMRQVLAQWGDGQDPAQKMDFWIARVLGHRRCARLDWRSVTSSHSHMWSWADSESAKAILETCADLPEDWNQLVEAAKWMRGRY